MGRDQRPAGCPLINSTAPSPLPPPAKSYPAQKVSDPAAEKPCSIICTISYTYLTSTLFCKAWSRDYIGNMPSVQPQCLSCRVVWSSSVLCVLTSKWCLSLLTGLVLRFSSVGLTCIVFIFFLLSSLSLSFLAFLRLLCSLNRSISCGFIFDQSP